MNLINNEHTLEVRAQSYYDHTSYDSFTCSNVVEAVPLPIDDSPTILAGDGVESKHQTSHPASRGGDGVLHQSSPIIITRAKPATRAMPAEVLIPQLMGNCLLW